MLLTDNDGFTDFQQASELHSRGLNPATADLKYSPTAEGTYDLRGIGQGIGTGEVPCWTFIRLLSLIPPEFAKISATATNLKGWSMFENDGEIPIYWFADPRKTVMQNMTDVAVLMLKHNTAKTTKQ